MKKITIGFLAAWAIMSASLFAQWQPGTLIAHNHTGPNDGGILSNLNVLGTVQNIYYVGESGSDIGANLKTSFSSINGSAATLIIPPGSYTLSSAVSVPANVNLQFPKGVLITKSGSGSLTFYSTGTLTAGPYQIFSGFSCAGDLILPVLTPELPQWFGVKADGINDDTIAFSTAASCLPAGGDFYLYNGTYTITKSAQVVFLSTNATVEGQTSEGVTINCLGGAFGACLQIGNCDSGGEDTGLASCTNKFGGGWNLNNFTVKNLTFQGNSIGIWDVRTTNAVNEYIYGGGPALVASGNDADSPSIGTRSSYIIRTSSVGANGFYDIGYFSTYGGSISHIWSTVDPSTSTSGEEPHIEVSNSSYTTLSDINIFTTTQNVNATGILIKSGSLGTILNGFNIYGGGKGLDIGFDNPGAYQNIQISNGYIYGPQYGILEWEGNDTFTNVYIATTTICDYDQIAGNRNNLIGNTFNDGNAAVTGANCDPTGVWNYNYTLFNRGITINDIGYAKGNPAGTINIGNGKNSADTDSLSVGFLIVTSSGAASGVGACNALCPAGYNAIGWSCISSVATQSCPISSPSTCINTLGQTMTAIGSYCTDGGTATDNCFAACARIVN